MKIIQVNTLASYNSGSTFAPYASFLLIINLKTWGCSYTKHPHVVHLNIPMF
ncbi:hypothetical protein OXV58_13625 [Bacteroides fragilis]|nr:hypothetical protein [Bacteroides fragilis]